MLLCHWNNLDLNQTEKIALQYYTPSIPTIGIEYFGVMRAIMSSEKSLQNHPNLDQSKT